MGATSTHCPLRPEMPNATTPHQTCSIIENRNALLQPSGMLMLDGSISTRPMRAFSFMNRTQLEDFALQCEQTDQQVFGDLVRSQICDRFPINIWRKAIPQTFSKQENCCVFNKNRCHICIRNHVVCRVFIFK